MNNLLKAIALKSSWFDVYNLRSEYGKARANLLAASVIQAIVNGFTTGIFYSGLLVGYGISLVNISIISFIPSIASFFTLLTPYVLQRFRKRRKVLTITRIAYYAINILGVTFLPMVVKNEAGRVIGIVTIMLVSNIITALFGSGYSPWHMHYITPEIRNAYHSSTTMVSTICSSVLLVLVSLITDSMESDSQLMLISLLRIISFAIAMLDVYFLQKPAEPEYLASSDHLALVDIFRLPLSNKKFMLTELIFALYCITGNIVTPVANAWLLDDVKASYVLINGMSLTYIPLILLTTKLWNKVMKKHGTFRTLAFAFFAHILVYLPYSFVNSNNYYWLYVIVRLTSQTFGLLMLFPVNNLIYVNLPEADQTNYISFHSVLSSACTLISSMLGTAIVAAIGKQTWNFLGYSMGSVPTLFLLKAALWGILGIFILIIRKKVEPDKIR